jgi:hypothetical protein
VVNNQWCRLNQFLPRASGEEGESYELAVASQGTVLSDTTQTSPADTMPLLGIVMIVLSAIILVILVVLIVVLGLHLRKF